MPELEFCLNDKDILLTVPSKILEHSVLLLWGFDIFIFRGSDYNLISRARANRRTFFPWFSWGIIALNLFIHIIHPLNFVKIVKEFVVKYFCWHYIFYLLLFELEKDIYTLCFIGIWNSDFLCVVFFVLFVSLLSPTVDLFSTNDD